MLRWIGYILAILVSVQTYAAMSDVYHSHQLGSQHLEISSLDENRSINNDVNDAFDCDHCCHCHSCHSHILIRENLPATQSLSYESSPRGKVNSAQIGILSQPYRPPRV